MGTKLLGCGRIYGDDRVEKGEWGVRGTNIRVYVLNSLV